MNENPLPDKRLFSRASVDCELTVSCNSMPMLPAAVINVSASGVYCVSSRNIGELTRVNIILRINGGEDIPARAVVIREEELSDGSYGIGFFFTKITEQGRNAIIEYTSDIESTG
ncbi:MAG: PilZ domain-containing protein [Candidatus Aegiribacteria sp.]|nr:PilZ domain-containing protein [Candidatus Aegiribacteria sp.]